MAWHGVWGPQYGPQSWTALPGFRVSSRSCGDPEHTDFEGNGKADRLASCFVEEHLMSY